MSNKTLISSIALATMLAGCSMIPGLKSKTGSTSKVPSSSSEVADAPESSSSSASNSGASNSGASSASSASSSSDSASSAVAAPPPKGNGAVAKLYASWSYKTAIDADERRKEAWELVAGTIKENDFVAEPNPDPALINTWKTQRGMDAMFDSRVMLQAAALRTWTTDCVKSYDAWQAQEAKFAESYGPELEKLKSEKNWYKAMAGFGALAAKVRDEQEQAGTVDADYRGTVTRGEVGFGWEIGAALVAYHNSSSHNFLYSVAVPKSVVGYRAGRPLSGDANFERDLYCAKAVKDGVGELPGLPMSGDGPTKKGINWPAFATRDGSKALFAKDQAAREEAAKQLALKTSDKKHPGVHKNENLHFVDDQKLAFFAGFEVKKVSGNKVELERVDRESYEYGCKKGKVIGIKDNGDFKYEMRGCKLATTVFTAKVTLKVDELPPGFSFNKGDEVDLYASVKSDNIKEKKKKKDRDITRTMSAELRHLIIKKDE